MRTHMLSLTMDAPAPAVFNYLADIEKFPAWSAGFCERIELHREGWLAYTAFGEVTVETKVDAWAGEIDVRLQQDRVWSLVIPLWVKSDRAGGTVIKAMCRQPVTMSDRDYGRLCEWLLSGLHRLRLPEVILQEA